MAKTRRAYTGGAVSTTTLSDIAASGTTSFTITANTGWPYGAAPFYVVVSPGTASEEKILVTRTGSGDSTLNVASDARRGQDGTSAVAHATGAVVFPVFTAVDADEANELASKWSAKGDLVSYGSSTFEKLGVGTNDHVLTAASGETSGLKWGQVGTGGIADDAVTTAKIDDEAVTTAKISTTDYAGMGLVYITSATATSGTALSVNNCFSAQFSAYRIVITNLTLGGASGMSFRMRASGTDNTTSNYYYVRNQVEYGTATGGAFGNPASTWEVPIIGNTENAGMTMDIYNPFPAVRTTYSAHGTDGRSGAGAIGLLNGGGKHNVAASYDGFTIYSAQTISSLTLKVYGYNNG